MHPTTFISLIFIFTAALVIGGVSFLLPERIKKRSWLILTFILILTVIFFSIRPVIIKHETKVATEHLELHLKNMHPNESWVITDTDEYRFKNATYLHVIFDNEPNIVYMYMIDGSQIYQIDMWLFKQTNETDEIEPLHDERKL